ncbi:REX2_2 [Sanghuangporus sanghuang]
MEEYARTPTDQRRTMGEVEQLICKYLDRHHFTGGFRQAIMTGAGIVYDRELTHAHMPKFDSYFHHQFCDITSVWHIIKGKYDRERRYQNNSAHRAVADIQGSMREAKMYLDLVFKSPDEIKRPF